MKRGSSSKASHHEIINVKEHYVHALNHTVTIRICNYYESTENRRDHPTTTKRKVWLQNGLFSNHSWFCVSLLWWETEKSGRIHSSLGSGDFLCCLVPFTGPHKSLRCGRTPGILTWREKVLLEDSFVLTHSQLWNKVAPKKGGCLSVGIFMK